MKKYMKIINEMRVIENKIEEDRRILKLLQYTEPYDEIQARIENNIIEHFKLGQLLLKRDIRHGVIVLSMQILLIGFLTYVSISSFKKGHDILGYIDGILVIVNIYTALRFSKSQKEIMNMHKRTQRIIKEHEEMSLQNNQTDI